MGDDTPFDSTIFDEFADRLVKKSPASPAREFHSHSAMARHMATLQPNRDPNDVRESYGLPRLAADGLAAWLGGVDDPE